MVNTVRMRGFASKILTKYFLKMHWYSSILWKNMTPWAKATGGFLLSLTFLLILTLFGGMYTPLIILALIPLAFGLGSALGVLIREKDWVRLGLLATIILAAWINLAGETPSIFTGRDQGSIAEAAWRLAENHELYWSTDATQAFFEIYGVGTALNFPGFAYTEAGSLITQFPLAYTAWLAGFVGWLGLSGYAIANTLLLLIAAWTFFELTHLFTRTTTALVGTLLFSLSFLPTWMLHLTLSEHLALALFLILGYSLILLRRHPTDRTWHSLTFLTASLFLFTRIEGFVFFGITLLIIGLTRPLRTFLLESPLRRLILPSLILGFIFLRDFFINLPFYKMIGKAVMKNWQELTVLGNGVASSTTVPSETIFAIFGQYGLIAVFILGGVGIGLALWREKRETLIILALALPTFIYLVDAHITPDHPWMLRRYYFTLWPTFVFFTIYLWHFVEAHFPRFRSQTIIFVVAFFLLVVHYPAARAAWQADEYSSLYAVTTELAERFGSRDLILIDRLVSGDPFRLLAGPMSALFEEQAVYFFNPEDLDRLNTEPFERVFLLVPTEHTEWAKVTWGEQLTEREVITFPRSTLTAHDQGAPTNTKQVSQATLFELK